MIYNWIKDLGFHATILKQKPFLYICPALWLTALLALLEHTFLQLYGLLEKVLLSYIPLNLCCL